MKLREYIEKRIRDILEQLKEGCSKYDENLAVLDELKTIEQICIKRKRF